ncbi:MAG: hypothetical protein ACK4VP_02550 [Nitrospira sp.]
MRDLPHSDQAIPTPANVSVRGTTETHRAASTSIKIEFHSGVAHEHNDFGRCLLINADRTLYDRCGAGIFHGIANHI